MKPLIVKLGYRNYLPAIRSQLTAERYWWDAHKQRVHSMTVWGLPNELPADYDGHDVVTNKYEEARQVFLQGEWDVFIAIEDDMVIPKDTFPRLVNVLETADVAYGLYVWRHGIQYQAWSAYTEMTEKFGKTILKDPDRAVKSFQLQEVIETQGVGMGCTAIKRHVLEKLRFEKRGEACNDWYFANDCVTHGFVQKTDMGLVCGHMMLYPQPQIMYPDPNGENYRRIEPLTPPEIQTQEQLHGNISTYA